MELLGTRGQTAGAVGIRDRDVGRGRVDGRMQVAEVAVDLSSHGALRFDNRRTAGLNCEQVDEGFAALNHVLETCNGVATKLANIGQVISSVGGVFDQRIQVVDGIDGVAQPAQNRVRHWMRDREDRADELGRKRTAVELAMSLFPSAYTQADEKDAHRETAHRCGEECPNRRLGNAATTIAETTSETATIAQTVCLAPLSARTSS